MTVTPHSAEIPRWRAWLTTDTPGSRGQARAVQAYLAWLGFVRNPLAVVGLVIIILLVLMAAFAPLLA
ncbi:MAG TPA: D,D-dipeptide ABC transporter permease, partial [Reyranella sp.]|nr:D,D-dipeptide ABC transporter permease [Reyranella sp.]